MEPVHSLIHPAASPQSKNIKQGIPDGGRDRCGYSIKTERTSGQKMESKLTEGCFIELKGDRQIGKKRFVKV